MAATNRLECQDDAPRDGVDRADDDGLAVRGRARPAGTGTTGGGPGAVARGRSDAHSVARAVAHTTVARARARPGSRASDAADTLAFTRARPDAAADASDAKSRARSGP
ncbi:MAG TPA: hypothetical protein VER17_04895, partial [Tepidisphaeraceae bacterium]|nr:hypothetical protein [Tepidisphaeraceae bacterium]